MESKGKTEFHKYYTFRKLTIISVATEIMTLLMDFMSNLPKTFGEQLFTKIMIQSLRNQYKTIKEIKFG